MVFVSWRAAFVVPAVAAPVLAVLFRALPESLAERGKAGAQAQIREVLARRWVGFLLVFALAEGSVILGFFTFLAPARQAQGHTAAIARPPSRCPSWPSAQRRDRATTADEQDHYFRAVSATLRAFSAIGPSAALISPRIVLIRTTDGPMDPVWVSTARTPKATLPRYFEITRSRRSITMR